jgi:glycerate dehydrogenase
MQNTPPTIVFIDAFTLNPGDLSWSGLESLGNFTAYDRSPEHEVAARCAHADIVLTNKVAFRQPLLARLPALRYIGVSATGYNIIDVQAARAQGILVSNVPGYGTESVAQHTFALILELANHVGLHARTVAQGDWAASPDWCYWRKPLFELAGKTIGIVGYGAIGQAVARIGKAFGMQILVHTARPRPPEEGMTFTSLDTLFAASDVVSLHCPQTPATENMVNTRLLSLMRPHALLINTSRGGLVDEQALAKALDKGVLAGAGLDVLGTEPPSPDHPLVRNPRCLITPHQAWASMEARQRLLNILTENVRSFLTGNPINLVG